VSKSSAEGSTCSVGGGEGNEGVDSNGGGELGGGVGTLLEDASTNLALRLLPSRKIYKTHQKNIVKYALGSGIRKCIGGSWRELTFLSFLVVVVLLPVWCLSCQLFFNAKIRTSTCLSSITYLHDLYL
jgi:hypothetical protein